MNDVTIAAVSMRSRPADPAENRERHVPWVEQAKGQGAEVCLFPEMSITGFCFDAEEVFKASEPIDGESVGWMISLAKQHDLVLGFGLGARSDRDIISNAYVFVSPDGYLGHYAKTHIPIAEYPIETPGNDFSVTDLGPVRMGVNICFDNWFCEAGRLSFLNGAEAILAPFYMGATYEHWKHLAMVNFPAAAYQNGVYHITINACGPVDEKGAKYNGLPLILIFNPMGELEKEGDTQSGGEQMVVHTLKAEALIKRRSQSHFHPKYRRPEIYGALTKPVNP